MLHNLRWARRWNWGKRLNFVLNPKSISTTLAPIAKLNITTNPVKKTIPATNLKREVDALQALHPNHVLLVQVGMFYEIYDCGNYLQEIADLLNLRIGVHKNALSSDHRYCKFAGFPMHQLKNYLKILILHGKTVGIVNQYTANPSSDIIRRRVTRIVTPGTLLEDDVDSFEVSNNFLLSIFHSKTSISKQIGLAWTDISTGEFYVSKSKLNDLRNEIYRIQPREILIPKDMLLNKDIALIFKEYDCLVTERTEENYAANNADQTFLSILNQASPMENSTLSPKSTQKRLTEHQRMAAIGLVAYLQENFPFELPSVRIPQMENKEVVIMDPNTFQALEITHTQRENSKKGSLLSVLNVAKTPMGQRLLRARLSLFY
jgi:DNA mismatch repair protein MutS